MPIVAAQFCFRPDDGSAIQAVCWQFVPLSRKLELFSQTMVAVMAPSSRW
jgi:hypothetical protein